MSEGNEEEAIAAPRPAEPVAESDPRIQALRWLVGVVDRLRAPDGCPWDRKQTEASMAPNLVEEAHELVEAIETAGAAESEEEVGDVLMNVVLVCKIAMESDRYDLASAAQKVAEKLVRRHPHVFGTRGAASAEEALARWEAVKKSERGASAKDDSALAGIPRGLPALQRAGRVCDKAIAAGFRWQDAGGALAKLREEIMELEAVLPSEALARREILELDATRREAVAHELGDVLLAAAHLARYVGLEPEQLAREAVRRFEARFRVMERELGGSLTGRALDELLAAWGRAKRASS
jgi:tetrapyrrole methylase family protein/MazG family protein